MKKCGMLKSLIAKTSKTDGSVWLPLQAHLLDTAGIAGKLWIKWLPEGVRRAIEIDLNCYENARALLLFLALTHDIGKATPLFQANCMKAISLDQARNIAEKLAVYGLDVSPCMGGEKVDNTPHALAGEALLATFGCNEGVAAIVGAHHGKPQNIDDICNHEFCDVLFKHKKNICGNKSCRAAWHSAQWECLAMALERSGFAGIADLPVPSRKTQVILSGLLIMADWIASNETYFPYIPINSEYSPDAETEAERVDKGWEALNLPLPWLPDDSYKAAGFCRARFGFDENATQYAVLAAARSMTKPGLMIIEASMGGGKTEAALMAAEAFADKFGRGGIAFMLPTQATGNGIFPRIRAWAEEQSEYVATSIRLAHGMAQLNEEYTKLFKGHAQISEDEESGVIVHEWFEGRKKALLADFVVGTIDQLLMAALKQKHVMLRHLGLANKVVIIDECHAFDAYMNTYLFMALRWLGAYGVPVIMLSATLPGNTRWRLVDAYLGKRPYDECELDNLLADRRKYPLLTYTDGYNVNVRSLKTFERSLTVTIKRVPERSIADAIAESFGGGGCIGVVVNTVKRAQELARVLKERFGNDTVVLSHAHFLMPDRAERERLLIDQLGKPSPGRTRPERLIVVGTQVLEQSLDIDFDMLITDKCPMDLLLQRIGRLQRHARVRPARFDMARCMVIEPEDGPFDKGSIAVYGEYMLMRTELLLPESIRLPDDISPLVQAAYGGDGELNGAAMPAGYEAAKKKYELSNARSEQKARAYRLDPPDSVDGTIDGLLSANVNVTDQRAEATVRDTDPSIEVLLLRLDANGAISFLPWREGGCGIPADTAPNDELARLVAQQRIRLPSMLTLRNFDDIINELEELYKKHVPVWSKSPWLRGELALLLDENNSTELNGYTIEYSREYGLIYRKKEEGDGGTR